ncbi:MAG: class Ib ribonucleoside-diphosphate reductase assembly flavoprotein NrdI [Defluviitaleaceae bacterium]|nr:class Ib ribonucleoside-diphosphate reductase assembly flavoprotein NrdI [Defluviitaleaceae bacterium]
MLILYDSLTGNVGRFIKKLSVEATQITADMVVDQDFILITFTTSLGEVPDKTNTFLQKNHDHLKGVASSGNKNFGAYYGLAADKIAQKYRVQIVSKFELSGTATDVTLFMEGLSNIMEGLNNIETY